MGLNGRGRKVSPITAAALSAVIGVCVASGQSPPRTSSSPVSAAAIDQEDIGLLVQVVDPTGAVIPNAQISLLDARDVVVARRELQTLPAKLTWV